jgi:hypothetical protein
LLSLKRVRKKNNKKSRQWRLFYWV